MPARRGSPRIRIEADAGQARREIQQTERALTDLRDKGGKGLQDLGRQTAKLGATATLLAKAAAPLVTLGAQLVPTAGALGGLAPLAAAGGQAFGALKLAVEGVEDALGGLNEEVDPKKLAALTKPAQELVVTLAQYKPLVRELQESVQSGLFPGLAEGIASAAQNTDALRGIAKGTGETLGDLAREAGNLLGSRGFGQDLALVGERNERIISRLGRAGIDLGDALRHVVVAAGPLANQMSLWALRGAEGVKQFAEMKRESGEMGRFFNDAGDKLEMLGSIGQSVGSGLVAIFKEFDPAGDDMLRQLDRLAQRFEDWAENDIAKQGLGPALEEAMPKIAADVADVLGQSLATAAPRLVEGFVQAFMEAGPWGKLFAAGFLVTKLGAWGPLGKLAAGHFRKGIATQQPAIAAQGTAAGAAYGRGFTAAAGTGITGASAKGGKLGRVFAAAGKGLGVLMVADIALAISGHDWNDVANAVNRQIDEALGKKPTGLEQMRARAQEVIREAGRDRGSPTEGHGTRSGDRGSPTEGRGVRARGSAARSSSRSRARGSLARTSSTRARTAGVRAHMAATGSVTGDVAGLNADFLGRLQAMSAGTGRAIFIQSGFRSRAEQQALWNANPNPRMVARPGTSNHETGKAADITPGAAVFGGVAGKYGLRFPMSWEPWHIEPAGGVAPSGARSGGATAGGTRGGGSRGTVRRAPTAQDYYQQNLAATEYDLEQAEGTGNAQRIGGAITRMIQVQEGRLDRVQKALRGKLSVQRRTELLTEAKSLVSDIKELKSRLRELREEGVTQQFELGMSEADLSIAEAQQTVDKSDDALALWSKAFVINERIAWLRDQLKKKLTPAKRTEFTTELAGLLGQLPGLQADFDEAMAPGGPTPPTPLQLSDLAIAQAGLTPATEDDLAALRAREEIVRGMLGHAQNTGDIEAQISLTTELGSILNTIAGLVADGNEIARQQAELARQRAEYERERLEVDKRLAAVAERDSTGIVAGVLAAVAGGIGGRAGLGFATPATGRLGDL